MHLLTLQKLLFLFRPRGPLPHLFAMDMRRDPWTVRQTNTTQVNMCAYKHRRGQARLCVSALNAPQE